MGKSNKFWWFSAGSLAITLFIALVFAVLLWNQLELDERIIFFKVLEDRFIYFFGITVAVLFGFIFILDGIFHLYIVPIRKLTEEVQVIQSANPAHRIAPEGGKWYAELTGALNRWAERMEVLHKDVEKQIESAKSEIEKERNIFAAILSELPQGVIVCNAEGQILLYDKQSRLFLDASSAAAPDPVCPHRQFIGLGRSIFAVMEKNRIVYALDEIALKIERNESDVSSQFVMVGRKENLVHVEVVPIIDECDRIWTGFALIMEDITERIQKEGQLGDILQDLTTGIRTSLAVIRSATEAMIEYPKMQKNQWDRFLDVVHAESMTIANRISASLSRYPTRLTGQWPRMKILAGDFVESVKRQAGAKLGILVEIHNSAPDSTIEIDSYSAVIAVLFLLDRLRVYSRSDSFSIQISREGAFVNIDCRWRGAGVNLEFLRKQSEETLSVNNERIPLRLQEILRYHEAEILPLAAEDRGQTASLRILFPFSERRESDGFRMPLTLLPGSRPEFYDFDLFDHYGLGSDLDDRPLSGLVFTVFDTETTGLDIRGGDEIISIGAVRIVNGRLLKEDVFDQLVDPKHPLSSESIRIHGISAEMLKGQPTIDQVLPTFHRFAEGTVLVAHNAAFDMQMLKMKENTAGVQFNNPVLDTLLLSAVIHPSQESHNLESISKRFGVSIIGRHTALGDAIVTGEIFLKLIQLLRNKDIHTLREAIAVSKKTFYARRRY